MSKAWRFYEGTTSANDIIKDMSKVLCTSVKTIPIKDDNGNIVRDKEVIIDKNWDIVYPKPDKLSDELKNVMDWENLTPQEYVAKINNQLSLVTDTVILKTTTSPRDVDISSDDIGLDSDLAKESIDMYVELYKPKYLIDPESYHPECERQGIKPYLITKDIYVEYAKKEAGAEYNLKELTKKDSLDNLDKEKNIYVKMITDSGTNSVSINYNDSSTVRNDLKKYGFNVSTNPNDNTGYINIPYSTFKLILNGNTKLSSYLNSLYKPKSIEKEYNITVNVTEERINYETVYKFYLKWERNYEQYTIYEGYKFKLEHGNAVKWDTVQVQLDDDSIGNALDGIFSINKLTYEIKCTKDITIDTEVYGNPILTYTYEKENATINGKRLLNNNHSIYIRMFDKINSDGDGPIDNIVDETTGDIIQCNSKVSEWSKLSWYQDFEEVLVDSLDADVGESNVSDGIVNLPMETPGLTGDTRLRFWSNCNNDRTIFVLMGNPSLDFSDNRHLVSIAYIGQIESFDNSINDIAGNFALFTSSSTPPCSSKTVIKKVTQTATEIVGVGDGETVEFDISVSNEKFIDDNAGTTVRIISSDGNVTTLKQGIGYSINVSSDKHKATILIYTAPSTSTSIEVEYAYYIEKASSVKGIVRDGLGNIISTVYPTTYGVNTATGVIDVSMLHTRSKAYYQKHHLMFNTTEEYMQKEMYGKSAYTGEYYADKIKVTHGNDGPRGMLCEMLAIDTSSLYAFDELIVNRDFSKDEKKEEETYVFFPITAPFSPFSGSPNSTYGVALKKSFVRPKATTDQEKMDQALEDLELTVGNLKSLTEDIYLPSELVNEVKVTWSSSNTDLIEFK